MSNSCDNSDVDNLLIVFCVKTFGMIVSKSLSICFHILSLLGGKFILAYIFLTISVEFDALNGCCKCLNVAFERSSLRPPSKDSGS